MEVVMEAPAVALALTQEHTEEHTEPQCPPAMPPSVQDRCDASDDVCVVRSEASQPYNHTRTVVVASVWLAFCVVAAIVAPGHAMAQEQAVRLARECAEKEVAAITVIEDHGEADDLPAIRLGEAGQTMLDARLACYAGRVSEALALYDRVLALGPVASTTGQRR
jgi:hypothetical protein